jgi:hypothetical protein
LRQSRAGRRARLLIAAVLAALALPGAAQAHHTAVPIVALDYRNRVEPVGPALRGVRASLEDAGRKLRVTVPPGLDVTVVGYLGEPFVRFSRAGVEANERSATAQGLRLVPPGQPTAAGTAVWHLLGRGHSLAWSDTRAWAPSSVLAGRRLVRWSVPLVVAGKRTAITGELTHVPRPAFWPWVLVAAALVLLAVAAARRKHGLWPAAAGLAGAAGLATIANMSGFALGGLPVSTDRWVLFATYVGLATLALALLTRPGGRLLGVAALAAFSVLEALSELAVFRHGLVVSALPATAVRLAASVGIGAGLGAAGLLFVAPATPSSRRRGRRDRRRPFTKRPFRKEQA